jgi:hypothetical protein
MKLINKKEMMEMPSGTIYQIYTPHDLGPPMIFGGPIKDGNRLLDYVEAPLFPQAFMADYWSHDIREKFAVTKIPFVIAYPVGFGYNGYFEEEETFLVWDIEDRACFAKWLLDPESCSNQQNDDPLIMVAAP